MYDILEHVRIKDMTLLLPPAPLSCFRDLELDLGPSAGGGYVWGLVACGGW